jgi:hypothetical protein
MSHASGPNLLGFRSRTEFSWVQCEHPRLMGPTLGSNSLGFGVGNQD